LVQRANKGASQEYVEVQVKAAAEAEAEKRDQMARQMAMQRTDLEASVSALRDAEAGLQRRDDMIRQLQAQMEALQGSIREKDAQLSKASSQLSAMQCAPSRMSSKLNPSIP
jgi:septal ring factor EnvC (AmiA/AmiB activator)